MADEESYTPSCSHKRKQPDDENEILSKQSSRHVRQSFKDEYNHLEEGDDDCDEDYEDNKNSMIEKSDNILKKVFVAQEKATIKEYDGIKITPFNLDEEREEGDFDAAGNFIYKDKSNVASDSEDGEPDTWADSIDWLAIEREEKEKKEHIRGHKTQKHTNNEAQTSEGQTPIRSRSDCYKQILELMRPDETVQKTLRRLGNNVPKRLPNQFSRKKSNPSNLMDTIGTVEDIAEAKRKLNLLIELAHQVVEEGDTDIYQKTFEQLQYITNS